MTTAELTRPTRASAAPIAPDPVRESMTRLPKPFALPLTLLTGRPHAGQRPLRLGPTFHLAGAATSLAVGLALSGVALAGGGWLLFLLFPGWAITVHAMRNLRMMIYHQCAHKNMWGRPRLDLLLGKTIAGLLMVQQFDRYAVEHVSDHHAAGHMTLRDPTVQVFLVALDLQPGMTRAEMWRTILGKISSPRFHAEFAVARIRSYFRVATTVERALTLVAFAVVAALATWLHGWTFVLVAWVLPLTVFFQMSNTLRVCVKHTFPARDATVRRGKAYFASLTNAIFLGEPAPPPGLTRARARAAWSRWSMRMLLVHFPARYLVLTGDTVCHDFHHRRPVADDWPRYVFAREADHRAGSPGWPPYRHVWGLVPAIDTVFASLEAADPEEFNVERLREVSRRELYAAFDD